MLWFDGHSPAPYTRGISLYFYQKITKEISYETFHRKIYFKNFGNFVYNLLSKVEVFSSNFELPR